MKPQKRVTLFAIAFATALLASGANAAGANADFAGSANLSVSTDPLSYAGNGHPIRPQGSQSSGMQSTTGMASSSRGDVADARVKARATATPAFDTLSQVEIGAAN